MIELHAAAPALPDLTLHWVGFISIAIFFVANALVIAEESTHLRKSNPVIVAGGMLWFMLAGVYAALGLTTQAAMIVTRAISPPLDGRPQLLSSDASSSQASSAGYSGAWCTSISSSMHATALSSHSPGCGSTSLSSAAHD
jgi:hypothetical protein